MVFAKFEGQTECIVGFSKIENMMITYCKPEASQLVKSLCVMSNHYQVWT